MILQNSFYDIISASTDGDDGQYAIRLNGEHAIYKAHFPGEPITPGVCILQMGLELLSSFTGEKLELKEVKNVKFLNILRPDGNDVTVSVRLVERSEDMVRSQIVLATDESPIAKLSFICQIVRQD